MLGFVGIFGSLLATFSILCNLSGPGSNVSSCPRCGAGRKRLAHEGRYLLFTTFSSSSLALSIRRAFRFAAGEFPWVSIRVLFLSCARTSATGDSLLGRLVATVRLLALGAVARRANVPLRALGGMSLALDERGVAVGEGIGFDNDGATAGVAVNKLSNIFLFGLFLTPPVGICQVALYISWSLTVILSASTLGISFGFI